MPGNIELVAEKGPHTLHLQDALAVIHDCQLILAHQFTTVMSSDELRFLKILSEKGKDHLSHHGKGGALNKVQLASHRQNINCVDFLNFFAANGLNYTDKGFIN